MNLNIRSIGLALVCAGALSAAAADRPNILILMTDDMGFSDPGCFGGEVRTPHLDALAAGGLRFTQFYNASRCCPTRAALLTGLYPHRVGLGRNGRSMNRNGATLAELLGANGYQTGMVGKWHLTEARTLPDRGEHLKWLGHLAYRDRPFGDIESYPARRGFQRHYGCIWGVVNFFDPFSLVDGVAPVTDVPNDFYFTDAITDHAVAYIRDFARANDPFFLYVAHTAPHWPLHALPEDIVKYDGVYEDGWDVLRRQRFRRQMELGIVDPDITGLPDVMGPKTWDVLGIEDRAYEARKAQVHAAMVDRVDQGIGRIVRALQETGTFDNTVIFFLSDNGASPEIPGNPGYDRPGQTRRGETIVYGDQAQDPELGHEKTYTGVGPNWANAFNTPWRWWKKESYEGGNHTPLVVSWPNGIRTNRNGLVHAVSHVIDLAPTCYELAGVDYPAGYGGHPILPLEGVSLAALLKGEAKGGPRTLYFEHEGGRAIREGDWKLVSKTQGQNTPPFNAWELYDLSRDRTEIHDLIQQQPETARRLAEAWSAWATEVGVPGWEP